MFDFEKRLLKNVDWWIIGIYLIVTVVGLLAIAATTVGNDGNFFTPLVQKQLFWVIASLVVFVVIICLDYQIFNQLSYLIYIFTILSLIAVFIFGTNIKGSQRWIFIAGVSFQPSEFAKIFLVLSLARLLERKREFVNSLFGIGILLLFAVLPIVLIYKQPDLGTSLVLVFMVAIMLFVAGLPWKYIITAGVGGLAMMPVVWMFMKDYQRNRILTFINPELDPLGAAYNVIQSKIAIGSGNWVRMDTGEFIFRIAGKGMFAPDSMTGLGFIPEQFTDFIFSAIGEGLGFLGTALILGLFILLVYRCFRIGMKAKDLYGGLVVTGLSAMFLFHVLVNIGMTMGLMPVTGLTLPFVSLGGTSYMANTIALGIIVNIGMRYKKIQF